MTSFTFMVCSFRHFCSKRANCNSVPAPDPCLRQTLAKLEHWPHIAFQAAAGHACSEGTGKL
jgi:hypothetical protein